jgi:hypothetical protein
MLYSTYVLNRLVNNQERYKADQERYAMYNMFTDVRRAIWSEVVAPENVNSFRRQLQLLHLKRIVDIYLSDSYSYPSDARTLAANDLDVLESGVKETVASSAIDGMTRAHFKEVLRQISAAKGAKRDFTVIKKK